MNQTSQFPKNYNIASGFNLGPGVNISHNNQIVEVLH